MNSHQIAPRRPINPSLEHNRAYKRWAYALACAQDNDLDSWTNAIWRMNPMDNYQHHRLPSLPYDPSLTSASAWVDLIHTNNPSAEILSEF